METRPGDTPYNGIDQANNGLPIAPRADNRQESNFRRIDRRIDRLARGSSPPARSETDRQEMPNYTPARRHSGPGDVEPTYEQRPQHGSGQSETPPAAPRSWWQSEALTVADVMTTRPRTVRPDASIREIAELMMEEDVGVVPVVEADGRLWGIVTDRDIVVRGLVKGRSVETCTASDVATTNLEVASMHDSLSEVIELMGRERIRRVPVLDDDDKLVGILALADIASRADYREDLQQAFQKISGRRSFWSRIWR